MPKSLNVSLRFMDGKPPKYFSIKGVISSFLKFPTNKNVKSEASAKRSL
jgi:hypothetical protein